MAATVRPSAQNTMAVAPAEDAGGGGAGRGARLSPRRSLAKTTPQRSQADSEVESKPQRGHFMGAMLAPVPRARVADDRIGGR